MIKVNYDAEYNTVVVEFVGNVDAAQSKGLFLEVEKLLPKGRSAFKLLSDISEADTVEPEVENEIGKAMDYFNKRGVSEIFRVLPDPDLDIAFNVLSGAHYRKGVRIHTLRSREEAQTLLRCTAYSAESTALLIVDPYNDFMSEGGKFYEATNPTAQAAGFYPHLRELIPAMRAARVPIVVVPHRRWREGDYRGWKCLNPTQLKLNQARAFAAGSWGGEFHPDFGPRDGDVVALEHWGQSGFVNTDLDAQLKRRGIEKIILAGMVANTCVEGTARHGAELGYQVTLVKDAVAAFDPEGMRAANEVDGPRFAHAIMTTEDLLERVAASTPLAHETHA
ncbi:MAG: cysteine hydrolase family protein [Elusimicrobiota bacterium]